MTEPVLLSPASMTPAPEAEAAKKPDKDEKPKKPKKAS